MNKADKCFMKLVQSIMENVPKNKHGEVLGNLQEYVVALTKEKSSKLQ